MKKWKAILALVLVVSLFATLFAACGSSESSSTTTNTDSSATDTSATDTEDAATTDDSEADAEAGDEEMAEIIFYMYDMRSTGGDYGEPINEAVNEMMAPYGIQVEMHWVGPGDWPTKVNLALSGGERMDLINLNPTSGSRVNNLYPQNLLMDISSLLETYAPETLELMADYIGTYTYDGKIYGVPTLRNYCKNGYIIMRTDVLNELGLYEKAENMTSWSEFEEILDAVYNAYTAEGKGMWPIGLSQLSSTDYQCTGDSFDTYYSFDNLGDSLSVIHNSDGKLDLYQATEGYEYSVKTVAEWASKGYVWPDSAVTSEFVDEIMKQDILFCNIAGSEYGVQTTKSNAYGFDVLCVNTNIGMVKTAQPQFTGVAVPYTSEEPEAAVKFINQLYTNADLMNLLIWGEEGKDYTVEDGQVVSTEGPHYLSVDFVLGNSTILTPLMGNGADFYEEVQNINATAKKSPYLGFALATGDMETLMSQITSVYDQYYKDMNYGGYTPEKLEEYINKLYDAGVQEYLDAAQAQLDAWLESNG